MDCSIVILSFNTKDVTRRCLTFVKKAVDYCQKNLKNKFEVVVVDNASTDGSVEMILKNYPWVKLIKSPQNLGFAKGNNLGMKRTKYPLILLINSDTFLEEKSLFASLKFMKGNPDCGVMGCKLLYENGVLQPSAGFLPNPLRIFAWMFGIDKIHILSNIIGPFHPMSQRFFTQKKEFGWIMGAFMLLRREVYKKTGGFDENYFMYTEEVEWCKRIKEAGFKIFYTPYIKAIHLGRASSKFDTSLSLTKELEGVLYYFQKHYPSYLFWARINIFLGTLLRLVAFYLLGEKKKAFIYKKALAISLRPVGNQAQPEFRGQK